MAEMIRLLFEYRDGKYVPLAPEKVRMVAPLPPTARGEMEVSGRFVELRSAEGEPVQNVRVGEAGPPTVEFPTGDPEQPFGRTEPPPGSILSVLVADDDRAVRAALVEIAAPTGRGERGLEKRDLADVALPGRDGR
jgi:hypothetical protein